MRTAFYVWEYPPAIVGGLGTFAQYVTQEFASLGWDVCVYTLNPGNLKTRENREGIEVHRPIIIKADNVLPTILSDELKSWGTHLQFFNDMFVYNTLAAAKMINDITTNETDEFNIISIHDWLSSIAGIICKNQLKTPVIFHVHSTEWGRSRGNGSSVVRHLESMMAEKADGIITVSHVMKQDLIHHGWPESKIHVVWNGIDPEKYNPAQYRKENVQELRNRYGIALDETMILFIGRLTRVKGVNNLIQAMPLIIAEYPNTKLVVLGIGEEQREIVKLADRLGISQKVKCRFEFVPEDERILHYAAADLCAFPSIYEPFGIVSLEAMAMAKPVVVGAKDVVGFREQVLITGPEQSGVHVNGANPEDIAWGIKEILRDTSRAKQWGRNGRNRVIKHFTWRKTATQTLDIYQRILNKQAC